MAGSTGDGPARPCQARGCIGLGSTDYYLKVNRRTTITVHKQHHSLGTSTYSKVNTSLSNHLYILRGPFHRFIMTDRYGHPRQTVFGRRHASAAATVSYSDTRQPHPPASSATQQSQQGPSAHAKSSSNAGVRRNLFQGQLTRRPTTGPGSNNSNEPGGAGRNAGDLDDMEVEEDESASSDIVVRDKNGEVELDEPPTLVVDDPDEIALDMRQENESELRAMMMKDYDDTYPVIAG